jgi:hypothetical protein
LCRLASALSTAASADAIAAGDGVVVAAARVDVLWREALVDVRPELVAAVDDVRCGVVEPDGVVVCGDVAVRFGDVALPGLV